MKKLLFFIFILITILPANALTMHVSGGYVNERVKVTLDKPSFVIFKMNNGTPIYSYGSEVTFVPHIVGKLNVEAICNGERAIKTLNIVEETKTKWNIVPSGTFIKTINGKKYKVKWRTALGVLEKAAEIRGFDYVLVKKPWGLYVKCIKGKCEKSEGATSGWMYWVNYPNDPLPGVSAEQYEIKGGDKITWYFSRSMEETPDTSPYKIEILVSPDYEISVAIFWGEEKIKPAVKIKQTVKEQKQVVSNEFSKIVELKPGITNVEFPENVTEKFGVVSLALNSKKSGNVQIKLLKPKQNLVVARSIYRMFELDLNKDINGYIRFRVPKQWLNEENATDVILVKDGHDLQTTLTNQDSSYLYFRSNFSSSGIFAITAKWSGFPLNVTDESVIKALKWLKKIQNADGGFANPGDESSISKTSWAIMALVAAKQNPHEWKSNGKSPIDYLKEHVNESVGKMGTADFARTILALVAAKENPKNFSGINFVAKLKDKVKDDGQIGDFIYTTIWGILALKACGENVTKSVEWLINQQNDDGGFAWAVGEKSDYDDTAAAIQALIAAGVDRDDKVIKRALEYLKTGQNDDGGFRYFGNSASNAASDAWIIQALVAAGKNPTLWKKNNISVVDHLLSLQTDEGYFKYTNIQVSNPGYMTVCAIMALLGKPHPIKAESYTNITIKNVKEGKNEVKPIQTETPRKNTTKTPAEPKIEKNLAQKTPGFGIVAAITVILALAILRKL